MNREIKFRVWDNTAQFYWGEKEGMDIKKIAFNFYDTLFVDDWLVFQQYTGLKDKNDKEIYEGDILKVQYAEYPEPEWKLIRVIYGSGMFVNDYDQAPISEDAEIAEVIGNIFENPEL